MGLTFGIAAALIILGSTAGTHRQIPYLHEARHIQRLGLRDYLREFRGLLRNKPFVAFFLVSVTFFVMLGLQKALALHMNTYFWALETKEIVYLLYAFFGATILTVPFVKYIIDWLDKKGAMNLGLWVVLLSFMLPTTLRLIGWFPGNDSHWLLPLLIAGQVGAGFGSGILAVATGSIVADVADHHELGTGKRQEGLLFEGIKPSPWMKSASNWFPRTEEIQPNEMRIIFMGTAPFIRPNQMNTSLFVQLGNGDNFVFDIGEGSPANYVAAGFALNEIKHVFITHLHVDHFGGLPYLWMFATWAGGWHQPLTVHGPSGRMSEYGTATMVEGMKMMLGWHRDAFSVFPEQPRATVRLYQRAAGRSSSAHEPRGDPGAVRSRTADRSRGVLSARLHAGVARALAGRGRPGSAARSAA